MSIYAQIFYPLQPKSTKFDKLLTDVVLLRLSQATEQEVGGRRTETE